MHQTAAQIAQAHHAGKNLLAMKPLTFSPAEEAILAAIDELAERVKKLERRIFDLTNRD